MLLGNYFHNINKDYKNISFTGISFDTKNIKKNHVFFAIKGNNIDGNKLHPISH
jgi:murE/murF fusion protein